MAWVKGEETWSASAFPFLSLLQGPSSQLETCRGHWVPLGACPWLMSLVGVGLLESEVFNLKVPMHQGTYLGTHLPLTNSLQGLCSVNQLLL
jgi:hypothetical protein